MAGFWSPVFVLVDPGGRVLGPGFGFVLGAVTMFASALIYRRGRPVAAVPDARGGLGGLRRRVPAARHRPPRGHAGRRRTARSPGSPTGSCSTSGSGRSPPGLSSQISFVPGRAVAENLRASSRSAHDLARVRHPARDRHHRPGARGRRPLLRTLRRASRRAAFEASADFAEPDPSRITSRTPDGRSDPAVPR